MVNYGIIITGKNTRICPHDARYLPQVLKNHQSSFSIVTLHEVSTVRELLDVLNKVREVDFSQITTLWIFVSVEISGKRIKLDQSISSNVIFETFTVLCPTLKNKSKVFVFQGLEEGYIDEAIVDYYKSENIEIPLPCTPGVLIFMHKIRGSPCTGNKTCLFKAIENHMGYITHKTELINLFRLIMNTIDVSETTPTPPFLFSTITNIKKVVQPACKVTKPLRGCGFSSRIKNHSRKIRNKIIIQQ